MTTILLAWIDASRDGFHPTVLYIGTVLIDLAMWQALEGLFGAKP